MRIGTLNRRLKHKDVEPGNIVTYNGERMYVREVDKSVLSKNLGFLVCPAEMYLAHDDDSGSFWVDRDAEGLVV